jgi:hypothetical protein
MSFANGAIAASTSAGVKATNNTVGKPGHARGTLPSYCDLRCQQGRSRRQAARARHVYARAKAAPHVLRGPAGQDGIGKREASYMASW